MTRHTKSGNAHTRKHTRPAAPSLEDTITPPSRLFKPTAFSPLPLIRMGMSTSVARLWVVEGVPHLAPRRLLRTHALQKTCQNTGTSRCLWWWVGLVLAAWPHSLWTVAFRLGCFLTRPSVYFWVLPMPAELLPHWVVIDRASLFWRRWGFGALAIRLKGHSEPTDWRLGVVWYGNRPVWRRTSAGGRMHAV